MELPAFLAFVMVSAALAAAAGPSTLFIVNNAVADGWRRAVSALSGDLVAIALPATLSAIGLGALLMAYPAAFLALRRRMLRHLSPKGPPSPHRDEVSLSARHQYGRRLGPLTGNPTARLRTPGIVLVVVLLRNCAR
jgi:hypothetical protein